MKPGKQKCRILKDIRRQIAEANDIEFITSRCEHRGDCPGTCPKCEAEVEYLEQQLLSRRKAGLEVKITGVSLGLSALVSLPLHGQDAVADSLLNGPHMLPQVEVIAFKAIPKVFIAGGINSVKISISDKERMVNGIIKDKQGNPISDATIVQKRTTNETLTNQYGEFSLIIPKKRTTLIISYPGMKTKKVRVRKRKKGTVKVVMRYLSSSPSPEPTKNR